MSAETNATGVALAREASSGVLPASPVWVDMQPNDISTFGSAISTVTRNPISKNRQREKGTIVDLDATLELPHDLTVSAFEEIGDAFMYANYKGAAPYPVTAVTATGFTVAANGALAQGRLIFARNFLEPSNNGLKVVGVGSTGTEIKCAGLVAEATPPTTALVEVAGVRGAAGDLEIDADQNLISTVLDFTTLGLTPGQAVFIGGADAANKFANAANYGACRVTKIEAHKLTLTKQNQTFVVDDGTGKAVDLYFGRFLRNVPIDDPDFVKVFFGVEASYFGLEDHPAGGYEYGKGFQANQLTLEMPTADKVTMTIAMIGKDVEPITGIKNTGVHRSLQKNEAFNTTANVLRLRVKKQDDTGLTSYFQDITLTLNNNVNAEKGIGKLGAIGTALGILEVDFTSTAYFSSGAVVAAIRNNETVSLDFLLRNNDGGLYFDIPSLSLGDGAKNFETNQSITLSLSGQAFQDSALGISLGITVFPYLPGAE